MSEEHEQGKNRLGEYSKSRTSRLNARIRGFAGKFKQKAGCNEHTFSQISQLKKLFAGEVSVFGFDDCMENLDFEGSDLKKV